MKQILTIRFIGAIIIAGIIGFGVFGYWQNSNAASQIDRSMYIWSSAFDSYSTTAIRKYLVRNDISTVFVSATNKPAFKKLLPELAKKDIQIEVLIGNNSLLTNPDPKEYLDNLLSGIDTQKIQAIHLDIEPHARSSFPDFHERESYYFDLYLGLLREARDYADNHELELSVDIPTFYPDYVLDDVYTYADTVYVMAYEIANMNTLKSRTSQELERGEHRTVIALRANDFATRSKFETYLQNASSKLGTSSFAMHDLKRFMMLDN